MSRRHFWLGISIGLLVAPGCSSGPTGQDYGVGVDTVNPDPDALIDGIDNDISVADSFVADTPFDTVSDLLTDTDAFECGELPFEGCPCNEKSSMCCLSPDYGLECGMVWIDGGLKPVWGLVHDCLCRETDDYDCEGVIDPPWCPSGSGCIDCPSY